MLVRRTARRALRGSLLAPLRSCEALLAVERCGESIRVEQPLSRGERVLHGRGALRSPHCGLTHRRWGRGLRSPGTPPSVRDGRGACAARGLALDLPGVAGLGVPGLHPRVLPFPVDLTAPSRSRGYYSPSPTHWRDDVDARQLARSAVHRAHAGGRRTAGRAHRGNDDSSCNRDRALRRPQLAWTASGIEDERRAPLRAPGTSHDRRGASCLP